MWTPIKAKRKLLVTKFGVGYYVPVNICERVDARWEAFATRTRFRLFIVKNKMRYARNRRSEHTLGKVNVSLPQGHWADVW